MDEAFAYLERAFELKSRRILWLKVDPRWDPLRADPRFDALLGRLGLYADHVDSHYGRSWSGGLHGESKNGHRHDQA